MASMKEIHILSSSIFSSSSRSGLRIPKRGGKWGVTDGPSRRLDSGIIGRLGIRIKLLNERRHGIFGVFPFCLLDPSPAGARFSSKKKKKGKEKRKEKKEKRLREILKFFYFSFFSSFSFVRVPPYSNFMSLII